MKIAIVRGDYLSSWEIPNSQYLIDHQDVTFFVGKFPIYKINFPPKSKVVSLYSPADLNFGQVSRRKMAILNRLFIDAHVMFGLEEALRGYDIAYVSETYYGFTHQCLEAKKKGYVKSVVSHASENTAFNNEGIWGKRRWKRQALQEIDKFVAITEGAKRVLIQEGCDPKNIVRLQPGVDLNVFKPTMQKHESIKLLFVGRLVEEKGIRDILRIFRQLHKKYPQTELLVVGSGLLSNIVKGRAVTYLGSVPYSQMPKIYAGCDIYLHYSKGTKTWVEQYGLTLIEAMACGLPVMGLDRGSVKEVVRDGGFVVPATKYDRMLAELIKSTKLRKETGTKALQLVKKEYDAYKHGQDLEKVFRSTLSA